MKKISNFYGVFWHSFVVFLANGLVGKFLLASMLIFCSCSKDKGEDGTPPPPSPSSQEETTYKNWLEKPVLKQGAASFLTFYTEVEPGDPIALSVVGEGWIDLNNNGLRDENETIRVTDGKFQTYKTNSHVLTLYGDFTSFKANETQIKAIDVSHCPHLATLDLTQNAISQLDLSKNPELKTLKLSRNNLTAPAMEALANTLPKKESAEGAAVVLRTFQLGTVEGNQVGQKVLDVLAAKNWKSQYLSAKNELQDYSGKLNPVAKTLDLGWETNPVVNQEAEEFVTFYTNAKKGDKIAISVIEGQFWIDLNNNGLQDTGEDNAYNQEKTIVVDSPVITVYGKIENFKANKAQLKAIDFSHNPNLADVELNYNDLTQLNFSKNTLLRSVKCYGNRIQTAAMEALANSMCSVPEYEEIGKIQMQFFSEKIQDSNKINEKVLEILESKKWSARYRLEKEKEYENYAYDGNVDPIHMGLSIGGVEVTLFNYEHIDATNFPALTQGKITFRMDGRHTLLLEQATIKGSIVMEKKYLSIEMKGDNQIITDGMGIKAEKGVSIKSKSEKGGSLSIYAGGYSIFSRGDLFIISGALTAKGKVYVAGDLLIYSRKVRVKDDTCAFKVMTKIKMGDYIKLGGGATIQKIPSSGLESPYYTFTKNGTPCPEVWTE